MSDHRRSVVWTAVFNATYTLLGWWDVPLRAVWRTGQLGITADLTIVGRRSGEPRSVMAGLLHAGGYRYVGHPNGSAQWTRNLAAAGMVTVRFPGHAAWTARVTRLERGDPERSAAIEAASRQQPWPGNWLYGAAWRHIEAVGDYFRLEAA